VNHNPANAGEEVARFLGQAGRYPFVNVLETPITATVETLSHRGECVNFLSNSFLGLCDHPAIIGAMHRSLEQYGAGAGSARLVSTQGVHVELEQAIAKFKGRESAIAFSTGMLANLGVIPALASSPMYHLVRKMDRELAKKLFPTTTVLIDKFDHACIYDGAALAEHNLWGGPQAKVVRYNHLDMIDLRQKLQEDLEESERIGVPRARIIITDGVFSIHGRLAPLDKIVQMAREFDAIVYVDDAHGTGVLGTTGRGTAELFGVDAEIDVPLGTLSKAFGIAGGFVAGSENFCDYLRTSRTYMFQTAMPPVCASGLVEAIKLVDSESWRRKAVLENADRVRRAVESIGLSTLGSAHHIIPILIGDEQSANSIAQELNEAGVLVGCIMYPAVPQGEAILRCNMMATHSEDNLDRLITNLEHQCRRHGTI